MKKVKLKLTKFQWSNLQKLYDYLVANKKKVKPHFNMSVFLQTENNQHPSPVDGKQVEKCGAVGCLIGHGVAAGIPTYPKDRGWFEYAERVFGIRQNTDICPLFFMAI